MDDGILDVVDLSKATAEAAEDIKRRKAAANLEDRINQAVAMG